MLVYQRKSVISFRFFYKNLSGVFVYKVLQKELKSLLVDNRLLLFSFPSVAIVILLVLVVSLEFSRNFFYKLVISSQLVIDKFIINSLIVYH